MHLLQSICLAHCCVQLQGGDGSFGALCLKAMLFTLASTLAT